MEQQQQRYAITSHRDGAHRAGRVWRRAITIVSAEDLTLTQLEMLQSDPDFTVARYAGVAPGDAGPSTEDLLAAMSLNELRARLIRRACRDLDPVDFTTSGMPEVSALKRLAGLQLVSAGERDQAWLGHVEAANAAAAAGPAGGRGPA